MMKQFALQYQNAGVSHKELNEIFEKLKPEILRAKEATIQGGFSSAYASLNLSSDFEYAKNIHTLIENKKLLKPRALVVIGLGGSNLGTFAIQEALFGKLYNEKNPTLKIYYADTVDSNYINDILYLLKKELELGHTILINVATKSGATTETVANFELFLELLLQYHPNDYHDYIVVTTDRDSVLWKIAEQEKFSCLEVPKKVGGRYSVFSAVGLFPLGMLGCDTKALLEGAASILNHCTTLSLAENYAAITACLIYAQYNKNVVIQDMFLFAVQLEGVGKWYRQLMGESLGKEFDTQGNKVEIGITPTVSVGSIDLHSVGQLYLGGPRDKGTTFIFVKKLENSLTIPRYVQFEQAVAKIQGKSLALIMQAILEGVQTAYAKHARPFVSLELPECSEYYLGQLLQYKMVEMIYLGFLLGVNPFDQPNVESYKKETRAILEKF